ncbi:LppA family lipoprotein [Amycolatopsis roodepoortensis]|uniref:LppA family lipoprotein n=1 Tax=Amycolatopsis roodepoortensis TaxID=700274 RepID=UPI00214C83C0|nr:LppA family lipoprotein [Amycolatopsis roodepoortensis]UUV32230.1 LppA family lipoprotein [Amycolatopsis roodepoortensis]
MASAQGFHRSGMTSDQPGNYPITLVDDGAVLSFYAFRNAVLTMTTGCHLRPQHTSHSP